VIRSNGGYSLPSSIAPLVSVVGELVRFPRIRTYQLVEAPRQQGDDEFNACGAQCAGFTTPAVLQSRCVGVFVICHGLRSVKVSHPTARLPHRNCLIGSTGTATSL
jgi:hypothetical protein